VLVVRDYQRLKPEGVAFNREFVHLGTMKYVMMLAPANVLIELFEVNKTLLPAEYHKWGPTHLSQSAIIKCVIGG
jgi:hypothetical protein